MLLNKKKNVVCILLGAGNDNQGNLDCDAIDRCNLLYGLYKEKTDLKYILCGGKGEHFNTTDQNHYNYLLKYLIKLDQNIEKNCIGFVSSYNTIDDVNGSIEIVNRKYPDAFVLAITNDYHVPRVSCLLSKSGISKDSFSLLSAPSSYPTKWLKKRLEHEIGRISEYIDNK